MIEKPTQQPLSINTASHSSESFVPAQMGSHYDGPTMTVYPSMKGKFNKFFS